MPLYEYLCESCGQRSEVLQRFDEPPLASCPHCAGPVRKLPSAPAFQFKGSGWYVTDYARKSGGEGGAAKSTGGEKASAATDGGEAKAAGTEAKPSSAEGAPAAASSEKPPTPKSGD